MTNFLCNNSIATHSIATHFNGVDNDSFFLHSSCFEKFDYLIIFTHDVVFYGLSYFDAQVSYIRLSKILELPFEYSAKFDSLLIYCNASDLKHESLEVSKFEPVLNPMMCLLDK